MPRPRRERKGSAAVTGRFTRPQYLDHAQELMQQLRQLTPLQMASGFAVFANSGFRVAPYLIERVTDASRRTLLAANPAVACLECALPIEPPLPPPEEPSAG